MQGQTGVRTSKQKCTFVAMLGTAQVLLGQGLHVQRMLRGVPPYVMVCICVHARIPTTGETLMLGAGEEPKCAP